MSIKLICLFAVLVSSGPAYAQEKIELSDKISEALEQLNREPGFSIEELINTTYGKVADSENKSMTDWDESIMIPGVMSPGDFGYLASSKSDGKIKGIFSAEAPIIIDAATGELSVAGYDQSRDTQITTVTGDDWANARRDFANKYIEEQEKSRAGRAISDVAASAGAATMTWAARLCPTYVYPATITLHLSAGFDFVVINSSTGTSIDIVMADACAGFAKLLDDESEKSRALGKIDN